MKNYIVTLSGEIKEANIISTNGNVSQMEYFELDGARRCMRVKSEIFTSKAKAKKAS